MYQIKTLNTLNALTKKFLKTKKASEFQTLMLAHENIISKLIGLQPVQQTKFSDYEGVVKSLGAWGGDFVLACGPKNSKAYFSAKGICSLYSLSRTYFTARKLNLVVSIILKFWHDK